MGELINLKEYKEEREYNKAKRALEDMMLYLGIDNNVDIVMFNQDGSQVKIGEWEIKQFV